MGRRIWNISASAVLALTILTSFGEAQAEGMLVEFQRGLLCDEVGQVEEIVSQFGHTPLGDVLVSLNERTGKISCGVVMKPMFLLMEPLRVVSTPAGKMVIVKLTDPTGGRVQYAVFKSEPDGQGV